MNKFKTFKEGSLYDLETKVNYHEPKGIVASKA